MKWYQSRSIKKVLDSLNESFRDSFSSTLEAIDVLKSSIFRKASYKSQAQVQRINAFSMETLHHVEDVKAMISGVWSWLREKERKEQEDRITQRRQFITGEELEEHLNRFSGQILMRLLEATRQADDLDMTNGKL